MKKIFPILTLLFFSQLVFADNNIPINKQIIGSWQSIGSDDDSSSAQKVLFWKRYKDDGTVDVIYGNGTRWSYTATYLIEDGKLYETSTWDGVQSIIFPENNKNWDSSALKRDGMISNISIENGILKLSNPEFNIWTIFKRQEKPDPELANMPDINQSYEKQLKMFSELVPNQTFENYFELIRFLNNYHISSNEDILFVIHIIYKSYNKKEPIEPEKLILFLKNYNNLFKWPKQLKTRERIEQVGIYYNLSKYKFILIGKSVTNNETWYYEYGKGWYKPINEQLVNDKLEK